MTALDQARYEAIDELANALVAVCVEHAGAHGPDPSIRPMLIAGFALAADRLSERYDPAFREALGITIRWG